MKDMHLIHDVAFWRLWGQWWSFQHVACWMWIILQLAWCIQVLSMPTENWETEPIPVDQPGSIHSNEWEPLAGDRILGSEWHIALHTQSKPARKKKYYSIQAQQIEKHYTTCWMLLKRKVQQREDMRVGVSMYTHTQSHKYSHNNCTSLYTIQCTPEQLVYMAIKQQCSTSCTVQCSVTVEWRLRYHSSTAGVNTVASKVLQFLTVPWVLYVGDGTDTTAAPQKLSQNNIMVEEHLNPPSINTQTSRIDNSPTRRRAKCGCWKKREGAKVPMDGTACNELADTRWTRWSSERKWDTSRKNSLVRFYDRPYHGRIRSHLQKHAVDVAVVLVVVVATAAGVAGVGVTYGDNHTQHHTAPCLIYPYTVHGTSCPAYTVPAFYMDIEIMKTKAQERYGNTSGMKNFLHKLKTRDTSESWSTKIILN